MPCAGCFHTSQQERQARRIIKAKAQDYATALQKTMVVYSIANEIKFTTLANAIDRGIAIEWVVMAQVNQ